MRFGGIRLFDLPLRLHQAGQDYPTKVLTDAKVRGAKPKSKAYKLADGSGLFLWVSPTAKVWRLKFRLAGMEGLFSIGQYPAWVWPTRFGSATSRARLWLAACAGTWSSRGNETKAIKEAFGDDDTPTPAPTLRQSTPGGQRTSSRA